MKDEKIRNAKGIRKAICDLVGKAFGDNPNARFADLAEIRQAAEEQGRERLFDLIEKRRIGGVLPLSGDRHGARVLRIPRPSGFLFNESELGSLGAQKGPGVMGSQPEQQPFGLIEQAAFGEFFFDTTVADPTVTMRVVSDAGKGLYQMSLARSQPMPSADRSGSSTEPTQPK